MTHTFLYKCADRARTWLHIINRSPTFDAFGLGEECNRYGAGGLHTETDTDDSIRWEVT